MVRATGVDAEYQHCDMAKGGDISALIEATVLEAFVGLDVLPNNAGVHESDFTADLNVETLPEEVFDRVYRINLRGPWLAMKYAAPHLRRSERGAAIVNAGSTGATGYPMMNAYGASKGGLIQLTKCVAVHLAPDVRVNCYTPASVYTNMVKKFTETAEDKAGTESFMVASHLIPRFGEPVEVAKLVCFLASNDAAWITGGVFPIDGGCLAWRGSRA